jgi:hypothetical protein
VLVDVEQVFLDGLAGQLGVTIDDNDTAGLVVKGFDYALVVLLTGLR